MSTSAVFFNKKIQKGYRMHTVTAANGGSKGLGRRADSGSRGV